MKIFPALNRRYGIYPANKCYNANNCWHSNIYEQNKFHAQLSMIFLSIKHKELLAIRRIFSLVDMIINIKFSNCPNVFEIGVVWQ